RKEPVRLARAVPSGLEVPAEAEVVVEGYIDPGEELVLEGPFGDHTGFYSLADYYPKVHVTAVTMRSEPIWPHTIVGRPPMEDYWLGHATERIFLPLLKLTIPEIVDIHMPAAGIFHNLVFVSIDKQYPGQAYKVMSGLWGQGLMSLAKVIVVFDKDVNVQDPREAWWVALNHIDPERDVRFTMGPVGADPAVEGLTRGTRRGRFVSRNGVGAEPALSRARARRVGVYLGVQLRQAVHPLVAPVAWPGGRDCHAGGLSGRHGTVERAVVVALRRRASRDILGGRVRRVLRARGRRLRPRRAARVAGRAPRATAGDPRRKAAAWARAGRARALRDRRGARRRLLRGGGDRGRAHRLGAPAREAGRSLAPQRRFLRCQRRGQ